MVQIFKKTSTVKKQNFSNFCNISQQQLSKLIGGESLPTTELSDKTKEQ